MKKTSILSIIKNQEAEARADQKARKQYQEALDDYKTARETYAWLRDAHQELIGRMDSDQIEEAHGDLYDSYSEAIDALTAARESVKVAEEYAWTFAGVQWMRDAIAETQEACQQVGRIVDYLNSLYGDD